MIGYLSRFWLALDILLNVLLGGMVETMSSRMGRALLEKRRCLLCGPICWLLSRWWPDHCIHNIMVPVNKDK